MTDYDFGRDPISKAVFSHENPPYAVDCGHHYTLDSCLKLSSYPWSGRCVVCNQLISENRKIDLEWLNRWTSPSVISALSRRESVPLRTSTTLLPTTEELLSRTSVPLSKPSVPTTEEILARSTLVSDPLVRSYLYSDLINPYLHSSTYPYTYYPYSSYSSLYPYTNSSLYSSTYYPYSSLYPYTYWPYTSTSTTLLEAQKLRDAEIERLRLSNVERIKIEGADATRLVQLERERAEDALKKRTDELRVSQKLDEILKPSTYNGPEHSYADEERKRLEDKVLSGNPERTQRVGENLRKSQTLSRSSVSRNVDNTDLAQSTYIESEKPEGEKNADA